jgi:hypothetical protein
MAVTETHAGHADDHIGDTDSGQEFGTEAARGSPGRPGGQSFQAAPKGRQAIIRLTRPTRVTAQRNNTK